MWVLLGTDKGKGIYRASWNAQTGALGKPELALASVRPSFFAGHPRLPVVYSADEGSGSQATVSAVRYDPVTGALKLVNQVPSFGDSPCYVSAANGGMVFSANYAGGTFLANRLSADGALAADGKAHQLFTPAPLPHPGPVPDRQDAPHLHCAFVDEEHCYVCDLGGDRIFAFPLRRETGGELFGPPLPTATRPGSGPRHITKLRSAGAQRDFLVIHELDCTLEVFRHTGAGPLARVDGTAVSTLPEGAARKGSTASEVVVAPGARFVYTAARGANVIAVFRVDGTALKPMQHISCGGDQPRWIGLDPSGRWLLCCNQAGNNVAVFARDQETGMLTPAHEPVAAESPMCVHFLLGQA
jgi:6-phosphogluconolactonase